MNVINIKERLAIAALFLIAFSITFAACFIAGQIEDNDVHMEYINIPDDVFEYIDLQLPDGSDEAAYVRYWYHHRAECDSVQLANMN